MLIKLHLELNYCPSPIINTGGATCSWDMENMPDKTKAATRIVDVARAILNDEIDSVSGSRQITDLRLELENSDDECFDFFVVFVSETDTFPEPENRFRYSENALRKLDAKKARYLAVMSEDIKEACRRLIAELS